MFLREAVRLLAVVSACVVAPSAAVESVFGKCPKVTPMAAFNMSRFEGTWYVQEVFDDDVECMKWEISVLTPGVWKIEETKKSGLAHIYRGKIYPDKEGSGALKVSWSANVGGKYPLTVYDTDYHTFAGVFLCQQVMFYSRQNGMILSRTPFLARNIRQKTSGQLAQFGVVMKYFQDVSQGICEHTDLGDAQGPSFELGGGGDYSYIERDLLDEDGMMGSSEVDAGL